jgi:hypothetical protein
MLLVVLRGASPLFRRIHRKCLQPVVQGVGGVEFDMKERMTDAPPRESPIANCDVCGGEMKRLGKLPASRTKKAVRVYRCYGCNNVTSEPW